MESWLTNKDCLPKNTIAQLLCMEGLVNDAVCWFVFLGTLTTKTDKYAWVCAQALRKLQDSVDAAGQALRQGDLQTLPLRMSTAIVSSWMEGAKTVVSLSKASLVEFASQQLSRSVQAVEKLCPRSQANRMLNCRVVLPVIVSLPAPDTNKVMQLLKVFLSVVAHSVLLRFRPVHT